MKFRRSLLRFLFLIPLIWFITTISFLLFTNVFVRSSSTIDSTSTSFGNLPILQHRFGFGELGQAVEINPTNLSVADRRRYEEGLQRHAFNAFVSDMISINRSLIDVRDPQCRQIQYKTIAKLSASVIICFHNELWSVLLRSVHSILSRTPSNLLKEIILVDDCSSPGPLKSSLNSYMKQFDNVKIVRQNKREGLIRSRIAGAEIAQGDALVFLDSHIEVTEGWLEPLLDPIGQNSTVVVTPIIDVIDDNNFKYTAFTNKQISVGGFDWNLKFNWHALSDRDDRRRQHYLEPARSPTMAGGLFAIDRQYFEYLGRYDDGMEIWGGENLEISFRIWMCGGTLLTAPCSHVGHIFRKRSPYKWVPGVNVVKKNSIRLAEVWLDEYKQLFYERLNFQLGDFGNVSSRQALRERLKCKSFSWYLTEVYPEQQIPFDVLYAGDVKNFAAFVCVDANTDDRFMNKPAIAFPCHSQGGNQFLTLTKLGEIRRDDGCLDFSFNSKNIGKDDTVLVVRCHGQKGNQQWIYDEKRLIRHVRSNLCLVLSTGRSHLKMVQCDENQTEHQWDWRRRIWNDTKEQRSF